MNIDLLKAELNKKGIYEDVRRDILRMQTVHSDKNDNSTSGNAEMMNTKNKKVYSSYDHYYHDENNSARTPSYNYHKYLKEWLDYQNTNHNYKVLRTKQRIREDNTMLQNEMTRIRQIRKNHRLTDYGANVQNMRRRIEEQKKWLRQNE